MGIFVLVMLQTVELMGLAVNSTGTVSFIVLL